MTPFSARHSLSVSLSYSAASSCPWKCFPVRFTACSREPDAQRRPRMRRACSCLGEATATFFLLPSGKAAIIGYLFVMTSSHPGGEWEADHASQCYLFRPNSLPAHSWRRNWHLSFFNDVHVCKSRNDNLVMLRLHKMAVLNLQLRTCCTDTHTHINTRMLTSWMAYCCQQGAHYLGAWLRFVFLFFFDWGLCCYTT